LVENRCLILVLVTMRIGDIIKNRKTQKVLADEPWPIDPDQENMKKKIDQLLDLTEYAP